LARFLSYASNAYGHNAKINLPQYDPGKETKKTLIGFGAYENVSHALLPPLEYDMFCTTIESILTTIPGGIA
jgi:hypothetical protein